MPSQPPLHTAVFAAIDSGALMLTANQRAARTLHSRLCAAHARGGPHCVASAADSPRGRAGRSTLWQQLMLRGVETRVLLSPMQERLLWKKILPPTRAASTLRSPESLATLAADAWSLLARFGALDANGGLSRLRAQFEAALRTPASFSAGRRASSAAAARIFFCLPPNWTPHSLPTS